MKGVDVTIVLCTLNRADYLRKALESVVAQNANGTSMEVLVVDNGSTDNTVEVARSFESSLPLRVVAEPNIGLCNARNTGWQEARGDIVAYLDDDAIALPGWLSSMRSSLASAPRAGLIGGPVIPVWEAPRPEWLSEEAARALTIVDWPGGSRPLPDVRAEWLAGANMAAPRTVLAEVGGFHPALDRVGSNMLSNGDIHLQHKIAARGYTVMYEPGMAIKHAVTASRVTRAWFRNRYFWQGISDVVMFDLEQPKSARVCLRAAAGRTFQLLRSPQQLRALLLPVRSHDEFTAYCRAMTELGHIAGLLRAARK